MKTYRSKTTGLFVGRQADQIDGEDYEIVEVPTNPKEALLEFLNQLQGEQVVPSPASSSPVPPASPRPQPSEEEQVYAQFRAEVAEGRVELDEFMLNAPLDMCLRLMALITDRTREHLNRKEKQNAP